MQDFHWAAQVKSIFQTTRPKHLFPEITNSHIINLVTSENYGVGMYTTTDTGFAPW